MRFVGKILEITGNRQSRTVYASFPDRTSGEGFVRRNESEEQFFAIILEKVPNAQAFCILVGCSCYLAHIDISKLIVILRNPPPSISHGFQDLKAKKKNLRGQVPFHHRGGKPGPRLSAFHGHCDR